MQRLWEDSELRMTRSVVLGENSASAEIVFYVSDLNVDGLQLRRAIRTCHVEGDLPMELKETIERLALMLAFDAIDGLLETYIKKVEA